MEGKSEYNISNIMYSKEYLHKKVDEFMKIFEPMHDSIIKTNAIIIFLKTCELKEKQHLYTIKLISYRSHSLNDEEL